MSYNAVLSCKQPEIRWSDTDPKLHWNLRSQNSEMVASGICVFVVTSEQGNQIGKLVIALQVTSRLISRTFADPIPWNCPERLPLREEQPQR